MSRKDVQRKRVMRVYIDSAHKLVETEGFEGVSIRKVSALAGYNSATLYNYFDSLDHLMFYVSMKYLRNYLVRLKNLNMPESSLETYILVWKVFSEEAFKNAEFYHQLFFSGSDLVFNDSIRSYYSIYPEELEDLSQELLPMLTETNIYKRDMELLKESVKEGSINKEDLVPVNRMNVLVFQGLLLQAKHRKGNEINDLVDEFSDYLNRIIRSCKK